MSLDFCRNSNTWHFVKRRKMALKFYTFKWRFLHFLHSYEQCWYVKLPQILCSFEITTWNFHSISEIIEKIKENVKLLRLVKITTLTTVQDLTFKQQLQTLIRSLKVINLVIWWQNLKDNAQISCKMVTHYGFWYLWWLNLPMSNFWASWKSLENFLSLIEVLRGGN